MAACRLLIQFSGQTPHLGIVASSASIGPEIGDRRPCLYRRSIQGKPYSQHSSDLGSQEPYKYFQFKETSRCSSWSISNNRGCHLRELHQCDRAHLCDDQYWSVSCGIDGWGFTWLEGQGMIPAFVHFLISEIIVHLSTLGPEVEIFGARLQRAFSCPSPWPLVGLPCE
jgi:hypothetical protein